MDWWYQLGISLLSVGAMYGAIRADLNNMKRSLDEERRLREELGKEFAGVRDRVARAEGASEAVSQLTESLTQALKK